VFESVCWVSDAKDEFAESAITEFAELDERDECDAWTSIMVRPTHELYSLIG